MKRWLFLAILALPLGGCVLPPALSIASLAVDVGSFAATGKSATDHVISGVAGEDCRMIGILEGEICREEQEFESVVATLEPLRPLPESAPDLAVPQPEQVAVARRAPVQLLRPEPPFEPMPRQVASVEASDDDTSGLAGLRFLSADLSPADSQIAPSTDFAAGSPELEVLDPQEVVQVTALQRDSDPTTRQVAALVDVAGGAGNDAGTPRRGMVYGDDGTPLGIAYAFQNPLAAMDGNRDSLGDLEIVDR